MPPVRAVADHGGMTSEYPCPTCHAPADLDSGCPACHRPPDPEAAEVVALNARYAALAVAVDTARDRYLSAAARLEDLRQHRNLLAARVTARVGGPAAAAAPAAGAPPAGPAEPAHAARPAEPAHAARPEASTRTVQNALFILGGLLLGSAAIVFTAVAWARFGVTGRAVILAAATALVLAVPPVALARRLSATAETFAALGLLLVLLDGYAAWYVDLAGVATGLDPTGYAGAVCALTAAVAAGYARVTGLVGPRFAGLVLAQPVLPLLAARAGLDPAGWAAVAATVALGDVAVGWRRRGYALGIAAAGLAGVAWIGAAGLALAADLSAGTVPAALRSGAVLVLVAAVPLVAGRAPLLAPVRTAVTRIGAGLVAAALVGAAGTVALAGRPAWAMPVLAAVLAGLALAVRALPATLRPGPRVGLAVWAAPLGLVAAGAAAVDGARTVAANLPVWHAVPGPTATGTHPQPVLTLVLLAVAVAALFGRTVEVAAAAAVPVALAVPAALPLAWWAPSIVDGVVAGSLVALAMGHRRTRVAGWAALLLAGHAVAASLGRPVDTLAVTAALVAGAGLVAALARRVRPGLGAVAAGTALVALPLLAAAAVPDRSRPAAAAGLVLATLGVLGLRRVWPGYGPAGLVAVPLAGAGIVLATLTGPYAGLAGLCGAVAIAVVRRPAGALAVVRRPAGALAVAGTVTGLATVPAVVTVAPAVWSVLVAPYGWVSAIWSGRPDGVGLAVPVTREAALTLALLAAGTAVLRWPLAALPVALAMVTGTAALGAPWPAVPALSLALGLAAALAGALWRREPAPVLALAPAGLAGALAERPTTLAALGAVAVVATVCGTGGRTVPVRAAGWLAAVASAAALAGSAALAAGLTVRTAAFWVLLPAGAALAVATLRRERPESRLLEAGAHAAAVVALLLTTGSAGYAAGVCTLWGVAVGLSALRSDGPAGTDRPARVAAAAGCELLGYWLLLASRQVAVLEAYTLPAAGLAVLAGWLAARRRPQLHSWTAYGPALLAGFGPSAVTLLGMDGPPLRRLALGAAALAVVVGGAVRRRQAPVVVGGATLGLVALHETVLLWDRLDRWILLGAAGLVLIGLAMTYERRRRELTRLTAVVGRMR